MVWQAMGSRWITYGLRLSCLVFLTLSWGIPGCCSLNFEGLVLLEFRARVDSDPYGALSNWNASHHDPCMWSGVHCVDGQVQMLDVKEYLLRGTLAPELGNLTHLRSLILSKNHFYGPIPKQFGRLQKLELLDLRDNNLNGTLPKELGALQSLKSLFLSNNKFEGSISFEFGKRSSVVQLEFDEKLTTSSAAAIACGNRKFGHCIWQNGPKPLEKADSLLRKIKGRLLQQLKLSPPAKRGYLYNVNVCSNNLESSPDPRVIQIVQNPDNVARRRLAEQSSNLAAAPINDGPASNHGIALPSSRSSGSFPAVPRAKKGSAPPAVPEQQNTSNLDRQPPSSFKPTEKSQPSGKSGNSWKYIVGISCGVFLLIVAIVVFFICRSRAARSIGPWKTGISGQLQKAFVTGVPKLNRAELETACEDFSNIIDSLDAVTLYKGTLSSGVEIAVASTTITSIKDWSKRSEAAYRKKIDILSRVNHKNFVNLIGYCEEDEPFARMMVFEYAPNGNLFEHLHVKEMEHLDWNARMRVIMGTAYCLQYMHDLNPPIAHSNLNSTAIYLTDDYAAKIAEVSFWSEFAIKSKAFGENESEHSELPPPADAETNVYSFGLLLLEIISGKLPYSDEQGPLLKWAAQYLNDKQSISCLIDPTLKSFKNNELDIICEVIQDCILQDARQRPTIKEITSKLRSVIDIAPDAATPRLSPLWWAELEILSAEAT